MALHNASWIGGGSSLPKATPPAPHRRPMCKFACLIQPLVEEAKISIIPGDGGGMAHDNTAPRVLEATMDFCFKHWWISAAVCGGLLDNVVLRGVRCLRGPRRRQIAPPMAEETDSPGTETTDPNDLTRGLRCAMLGSCTIVGIVTVSTTRRRGCRFAGQRARRSAVPRRATGVPATQDEAEAAFTYGFHEDFSDTEDEDSYNSSSISPQEEHHPSWRGVPTGQMQAQWSSQAAGGPVATPRKPHSFERNRSEPKGLQLWSPQSHIQRMSSDPFAAQTPRTSLSSVDSEQDPECVFSMGQLRRLFFMKSPRQTHAFKVEIYKSPSIPSSTGLETLHDTNTVAELTRSWELKSKSKRGRSRTTRSRQ